MNKRLVLRRALPALALTMLAASSLVGAVGPVQAQEACASLVITGHPAHPPVAWAAEGRIVGAAPALVRGIAIMLGVKDVVSKDYGSWEGAQAAARNGEADVIFGIYKTDERARTLDFIEPPFMADPVAIVVRKGAGFVFGEWSTLKGRKGVTNAGESYGDKFDAFMVKELTVARAAGVDKTFAALLAGEADYMIIGLYSGHDEARRLGLADKVAFLPKELLSSAMYVAFSKKSKCGATLQAGFAADIRIAVDSGTVRQLLEGADKGRTDRGCMVDKSILSRRAAPAISMLAVAAGALALGAVAIGAVAIGQLAIGRLAVKRVRVGALEVDELTVRRLNVVGEEKAGR